MKSISLFGKPFTCLKESSQRSGQVMAHAEPHHVRSFQHHCITFCLGWTKDPHRVRFSQVSHHETVTRDGTTQQSTSTSLIASFLFSPFISLVGTLIHSNNMASMRHVYLVLTLLSLFSSLALSASLDTKSHRRPHTDTRHARVAWDYELHHRISSKSSLSTDRYAGMQAYRHADMQA